MTGQCGIPSTAEAVVLNVTVLGATVSGDLRVYPTGYPLPTASGINYNAAKARANNGTYSLSSTGSLSIHNDEASGSANVILEVFGYFETASLPPPPTPTPTPTPPPTTGGAHVWSTDFGGSGSSLATPVGIAVDSGGASVVLGYFSGTVSFGGVAQTSAGLGDISLVKFSSNGSLIWVKRFGGTGDDVAKGIAIDASDNIYITGYFRSTVDFGGGPLTTAGTNAFLAKYASTGAHLWSKRLNSVSGIDEGTAVGVDGSGNAIVAVGVFGTSDFGGGPLTTAGGSDVALVKYSPTGAYLWSRKFGGPSDDLALSLAVDRTTGETWATGYFAGSVDFGGGALTSAGGNDIFVVKYSSSGSHLWSRRFGNTSTDKGYGIDVDLAGNVVVTGMFTGNVDFGAGTLTNTGGGDIFLVKYSASGVCQWTKNWGSAISIDEHGYAVAFDGSGSVLLTGAIEQPINFGGGTLTGDGWYNTFIAKFTAAGTYSWAKRYVNGTGNSNGWAIASDGAGNALATGDFDVAINFGGATMTSPGGTDTYLVKLGP
jgi:hypothetical protein